MYKLHQCLHQRSQTLSSLDVDKGSGRDKMSPSVVGYCQDSLAEPLQIFNESFANGVFPSAMQNGFIILLPKEIQKRCKVLQSYHRIILVIGKVSLKVLLWTDIHFSNVLHPSQHGFVSGKFTVSNLLLFQEFVLSAFRRNMQLTLHCVHRHGQSFWLS